MDGIIDKFDENIVRNWVTYNISKITEDCIYDNYIYDNKEIYQKINVPFVIDYMETILDWKFIKKMKLVDYPKEEKIICSTDEKYEIDNVQYRTVSFIGREEWEREEIPINILFGNINKTVISSFTNKLKNILDNKKFTSPVQGHLPVTHKLWKKYIGYEHEPNIYEDQVYFNCGTHTTYIIGIFPVPFNGNTIKRIVPHYKEHNNK